MNLRHPPKQHPTSPSFNVTFISLERVSLILSNHNRCSTIPLLFFGRQVSCQIDKISVLQFPPKPLSILGTLIVPLKSIIGDSEIYTIDFRSIHTTSSLGGAISLLRSGMYLEKCTFDDCSAVCGGGLYLLGLVLLESVTFRNCVAQSGSAVYSACHGDVLEGVVFTNGVVENCASTMSQKSDTTCSTFFLLTPLSIENVSFTGCTKHNTTIIFYNATEEPENSALIVNNASFMGQNKSVSDEGSFLHTVSVQSVLLDDVAMSNLNSLADAPCLLAHSVGDVTLARLVVKNCVGGQGAIIQSLHAASSPTSPFTVSSSSFELSDAITTIVHVEKSTSVSFDSVVFTALSASSAAGCISLHSVDKAALSNCAFRGTIGKTADCLEMLSSTNGTGSISLSSLTCDGEGNEQIRGTSAFLFQNLDTVHISGTPSAPCVFKRVVSSLGVGGCVRCENIRSVLLQHCSFEECIASTAGVLAILNPLGSINVSSCSFTRCSAAVSAGAFLLRVFNPDSPFTMSNLSFHSCSAGQKAGALQIEMNEWKAQNTEISIQSANFVSCSALHGGACFFSWSSPTHVTLISLASATFTNNTATGFGGAVFARELFDDGQVESNGLQIYSSKFEDNSCQRMSTTGDELTVFDRLCGGAIFVEGDEVKMAEKRKAFHVAVEETSFSGNSNTSVSVRFGSLMSTSSTFANDTLAFDSSSFSIPIGCFSGTVGMMQGTTSLQDGMACNRICNSNLGATDAYLACKTRIPKITATTLSKVIWSEQFDIPPFRITVSNFVNIAPIALVTNQTALPSNTSLATSHTNSPSSFPLSYRFNSQSRRSVEHTPLFSSPANSDVPFLVLNVSYLTDSKEIKFPAFTLKDLFATPPSIIFVFISPDGGTTWAEPIDVTVVNTKSKGNTNVIVISAAVGVGALLVAIIVVVLCMRRRSKQRKQDGWKKLEGEMEIRPAPVNRIVSDKFDFDF